MSEYIADEVILNGVIYRRVTPEILVDELERIQDEFLAQQLIYPEDWKTSKPSLLRKFWQKLADDFKIVFMD